MPLAVPPPPPALVQPAGPQVPVLHGVPRRLAAIPEVAALARQALREAGAVVVVEDDLPVFNADLPPSLNLLGGRFRLFGTGVLPSWVGPVAVPFWNDPGVTRAGGNIVGRVFTVGGAGF